jgi:hypothetical protein
VILRLLFGAGGSKTISCCANRLAQSAPALRATPGALTWRWQASRGGCVTVPTRPVPMDPEARDMRRRILRLAAGARELPVRVPDAIAGAQAPGGDLARNSNATSKAGEQAARIAGMRTLWRDLKAPAVQAGDMG